MADYERPNLATIYRHPVTAGLALLAIGVSVYSFTKHDVSALVIDGRAFHGPPWQPWRLVTTILPHGNPFHLLFNLYWLWEFGAVLERRWGTLRFAATVVLLAAGSSAAEYAFFGTGIGLSGVGYGLFGLLWVLGQRTYEWSGVLRPQVVQLFVAWFFICIVLTAADIYPIANVAHGAGAVLGGMLGLIVSSRRRPAQRALYIAATALLLTAIGVATTVARPLVNFASDGHADLFNIGIDAHQRGDKQAALVWYERAARMRSAHWGTWQNLGIIYLELGRDEEAAAAFERAAALRAGEEPKGSPP